MLTYDITYYDTRTDKRLPDLDKAVPDSYLATIPASLKPHEEAFATCLNNPHENRRIDRSGVHRAAHIEDCSCAACRSASKPVNY